MTAPAPRHFAIPLCARSPEASVGAGSSVVSPHAACNRLGHDGGEHGLQRRPENVRPSPTRSRRPAYAREDRSGCLLPALLTSISRRPRSATTCSTRRPVSGRLLRSETVQLRGIDSACPLQWLRRRAYDHHTRTDRSPVVIPIACPSSVSAAFSSAKPRQSPRPCGLFTKQSTPASISSTTLHTEIHSSNRLPCDREQT